jgi:seryl-tRNA synthetase
MKVKEYLSQAIWLDQRINSKLEQLETLRALAMRVTTNFAEQKVSGGNDVKSRMEKTVTKIIDLEKEINEDIDKLVDLKADIIGTISQVDDPTGQLLLEMRYINGKTWEEVAMDLGFDRRWVLRLHGGALK